MPVGSKCRLLESLPAELRNRIYRYALVSSEPIQAGFISVSAKEKGAARTTEPNQVTKGEDALGTTEKQTYRFTMAAPLTMASRQLGQETLAIYLGENTFQLSFYGAGSGSEPAKRFGADDLRGASISKRSEAFQAWCKLSAPHLTKIRVQLPSFSKRVVLRIGTPAGAEEVLFFNFDRLAFTATQVGRNITVTDFDAHNLHPRRRHDYCAHQLEACDNLLEFLEKVSQIDLSDPGMRGLTLFFPCDICG